MKYSENYKKMQQKLKIICKCHFFSNFALDFKIYSLCYINNVFIKSLAN